MKRRDLLTAAAAAGVAMPAFAQSGVYPTRPIRIIPFGEAGNPLDTLARMYGEKLSQAWGQPVVVEVKPGASGILAVDHVAKAAPDGHTLLFTLSHTQLVLPSLQKVPYDPVNDFQPLTPVGVGGPVLMVRSDTPANNISQFVSWAKAKGRVTYGTWGQGTAPHLYTELLKAQTGAPLEHVAYKGQGPAHLDLFGGVLDAAWANPATARTHLKVDGQPKVKVLGIAGTKRVQAVPDTATFLEQGYKGGYELDSWFGFLAPARTPRATVDKVAQKLRELTQTAEIRSRLIDIGLEPSSSTPEEFARSQKADLPQWAALLKASGVKLS